MRSIFLMLTALFIYSSAFCQVPQKMTYQAVLRNSTNSLLVNTVVGMRISILQGSVSGNAVYVETHTPTTNGNGLVTLSIGAGSVVSGTFSSVNWANGPYFIKTETDPAGGTNYTITGTSELMSVPYALMAAGITSPSGGSINDVVADNRTSNIGFIAGSRAYVYNTQTSTWFTQNFSSGVTATLVGSNGNFGFLDNNAGRAYVFDARTSTWTSQSYSGSGAVPVLSTSNGNFCFLDNSAGRAYAYDSKTATWVSQNYSGSGTAPVLANGKGSFGFVDGTGGQGYVFDAKNHLWHNQAFSGGGTATMIGSNGNFSFVATNSARVFVYNGVSSTWSSQSYTAGSTVTLQQSESN